MAKRVADTLLNDQLILRDVEPDVLAAEVERLITEELMLEDRLNDEVREFLSSHENNIDSGNLDYRSLFEMTKKRLIKERGIII